MNFRLRVNRCLRRQGIENLLETVKKDAFDYE